MSGKGCAKKGKKHRAHTPVVSKAQRGAMGAAYAAKKAGTTPTREPSRSIAKSMSKKDLKSHLIEVSGKSLPKRTRKKT